MDSASLRFITSSVSRNDFVQVPQNRLAPAKKTLGPPSHLTSYSVTNVGGFNPTDNARRVFSWPVLGTNLTEGYEQFRRCPPAVYAQFGIRRRLDHILRALLEKRKDSTSGPVHIVTWRRIIYELMDRTPMDLNMSFIDGVLYLEQVWIDIPPVCPSKEVFTGYGFEAACTPVTLEYGTYKELHPSSWFAVIQRSLGDLRIVFSAEVDCVHLVEGKYQNSPSSYCELKTSKLGSAPLRKSKLLQSIVTGTPTIYVGYRDTNSILKRVETVQVKDHLDECSSQINTGYRILKSLYRFAQSAQRTAKPDTVWRVNVSRGDATNGEMTVLARVLTSEEVGEVNKNAGDSKVCKRTGIVESRWVGKMKTKGYSI